MQPQSRKRDREEMWRKRQNDAGLCEDCCLPLASNSKRKCTQHLAAKRERVKAKIAAHLKAGICADCQERMCPDSTRWCDRHLRHHVKAARVADARARTRIA